jgi:hypothetical protein
MAQNPIIRNQYTADPTVRIFNKKLYLFPSHDIAVPPNKNLRENWFCMSDYHVFSSENMTEWTDHGIVVSQEKVAWVDSMTYSMWAPDCVERNGKYYFYFPSIRKTDSKQVDKNYGVGVAIASKPEGPYLPQPKPITNIYGIDPNVFINKDGQAYIFWAENWDNHRIMGAKLADNMLELSSVPKEIEKLPVKGLKEGPFLFERNGLYYLTYPHVENKIERLEYAIGKDPLGPFETKGVIMDESPLGCWTNHQSVVNFKGQWYLFYHQNEYSPTDNKRRSVCVDSLFFNPDGTIRTVIPTHRGVGITNATQPIEPARYSSKSTDGISTLFVNPACPFEGWKTGFEHKNAWVCYNGVSFDKSEKRVQVKSLSPKGGKIRICLDSEKGKTIAQLNIPKSKEWKITETNLSTQVSGLNNLYIISDSNDSIEVDWILFVQ